jgi:hypothetical protein
MIENRTAKTGIFHNYKWQTKYDDREMGGMISLNTSEYSDNPSHRTEKRIKD